MLVDYAAGRGGLTAARGAGTKFEGGGPAAGGCQTARPGEGRVSAAAAECRSIALIPILFHAWLHESSGAEEKRRFAEGQK
jgi:hypothetical protein